VNRKRVVWISVTLLIVVAIGGFTFYQVGGFQGAPDQAAGDTSAAPQEAVARRGNLTVTTSGTGSLVPASQIDLGFSQGGLLTAVDVAPGDFVKAGDRLARLQVDKSAAQLSADVAAAQLALVTAQQKLDDLFTAAQVQTAQAQVDLQQAQYDLEDLTASNNLAQAQAQQAVAQAKQAVQQDQMDLYILNSKPSAAAIQTAQASLLFKEKDLQATQDQIAKLEYQIKSASDKKLRDGLKHQLLNLNVKLAQQREDYTQRLYNFQHMSDPPDPVDVAAAQAKLQASQAQLDAAQRSLADLQAGATDGQLAVAQVKVKEAQEKWDRVQDGPDTQELELAQVQLAKAQAQLAVAKQEQQNLDLVAPSDGRVLSVDAVPGDRISSGSLLTLADVSALYVQTNMDETDLPNLKVGQSATVTFDALSGQSFQGQIVSIAPSLANLRGASAVRLQVQLDQGTAQKLQASPLGLNASVEVVVGQVTGAVIVPLEALQQQADGSDAVYVIRDGQPQLQAVKVGLTDYVSAAITSGLDPGETVLLGSPQTAEGVP
jgi:HlyD family secretion protein